AERDQTLREQLDAHGRALVLRQLVGKQGRNPVAAEHPAHRRAWAGLGQQIVLFFPEHAPEPPLRMVRPFRRLVYSIRLPFLAERYHWPPPSVNREPAPAR